VQEDHGDASAAVAHSFHQFLEAGTCLRSERVACVTQIVKVDSREVLAVKAPLILVVSVGKVVGDTVVRLGLSALAALYRGADALEASIVNVVSSATHVEDLLSYIRTGESRSELIQRLTSGPGAPSGKLLRAFATLAGAAASPAESVASSALEALASAERNTPNAGAPGVTTGDVRFVEP
jgi:hypothetical protein